MTRCSPEASRERRHGVCERADRVATAAVSSDGGGTRDGPASIPGRARRGTAGGGRSAHARGRGAAGATDRPPEEGSGSAAGQDDGDFQLGPAPGAPGGADTRARTGGV